MKRAERMKLLGTETAFEVLAEVKKLEAKGKDVINFAIGEPDFSTPEHIKEAGIAAIRRNETHYGPSAGIYPLRKAIAEYIRRTRNIRVEPENVVVTPGAKPIILYTILACVNPGDEVVYPNPGFPIYESLIRFVGAKPVPVPLLEERGFRFDVDELRRKITKRTSLIILNSPHNPTGGMLTASDLEAVAELALEHDLWVLSDEIYSRIVFDGNFKSIASLPDMQERTVILDGFSKTYAMTGWRLGYGVMNAKLALDVARLVTNVESCTATFTQWAGVAALEGSQEANQMMLETFRKRRDLIVNGLNDVKGISCLTPKGAFYVFANVTKACRHLGLRDSKALQQKLLYEGNVAVLPRTSFGRKNAEETEEYVRLSYATSEQQINEGLRRIKAVIEG